MRQVSERAIWLGNVADLRDVRSILNAGIEAVVELADIEMPVQLPREIVHCRFPILDGGENPKWLLGLAMDSVATLRRADVATLVCCSAGISRSICIAAAGLALAEERPLVEMLNLVVGTGPADVSPGLLMQLRHWLEGR